MNIVDIEKAKEGMVIVEEVLNEKGAVLLKEGTTLTKDLVERLSSLEISGICVEKAEKDDSPENIPSEMLPELEELEYKFSDVRGNEIMEVLLSAAKEYLVERGGSDGTY